MSEPPRGHRRAHRVEPPTPRQRSTSELDSFVRDFATRVQRLEKELADLRGILEDIEGPARQAVEIR